MPAPSTDAAEARSIYLLSRQTVLGRFVASLGSTGFLTPEEPQRIVELLRGSQPRRLLDVGCGSARFGLWIAAQLGAEEYLGIDRVRPSNLAFDELTPGNGIACAFREQNFETLDLGEEECFDGMVSHDALYLADRPEKALARLAAVLDPAGILVATVYVGAGVVEGGVRGRSLDDWRGFIKAADFDLVGIEDLTSEWRDFGERLHRERLRLCAATREVGPGVAGLARISRRMLGLDGAPSFLESVGRYRLWATPSR